MRFACLLAFAFGLIQASARPSADGRTPAGRMTDIIERVEGAGTSWHYTYDTAGQLQTVHEGADLRESFTYDFNGNLQVVGAMVSPEVDRRDRLPSFEGDEFVVGYAYNILGQRTMACKVTCEGISPWKLWEYTYDALGSLLQAVQFSAANENVEVGGVEYLIGPGGQRIGRRTWTTVARVPDFDPWRYWLYLDALNPVAELDENGTLQAVYVYATRGHVPSLVHRRVAGGWQHLRLLTDHRGSARMAVDTTNGDIVWQASYTTYGERTLQVGAAAELIPFGFAGGLHDERTGLVRFGARDLDPKTGRWTTPDPLGFSAGDSNLYAYAGNDPVNFIDPTGLQSIGCFLGSLLPGAGLIEALRLAIGGRFALAALAIASELPWGKGWRAAKRFGGWGGNAPRHRGGVGEGGGDGGGGIGRGGGSGGYGRQTPDQEAIRDLSRVRRVPA